MRSRAKNRVAVGGALVFAIAAGMLCFEAMAGLIDARHKINLERGDFPVEE